MRNKKKRHISLVLALFMLLALPVYVFNPAYAATVKKTFVDSWAGGGYSMYDDTTVGGYIWSRSYTGDYSVDPNKYPIVKLNDIASDYWDMTVNSIVADGVSLGSCGSNTSSSGLIGILGDGQNTEYFFLNNLTYYYHCTDDPYFSGKHKIVVSYTLVETYCGVQRDSVSATFTITLNPNASPTYSTPSYTVVYGSKLSDISLPNSYWSWQGDTTELLTAGVHTCYATYSQPYYNTVTNIPIQVTIKPYSAHFEMEVH